jgi:hypothetical protein
MGTMGALLSSPPSHPLAEGTRAKDCILTMLQTAYTTPDMASRDIQALTDLVTSAIAAETFILFTTITLREDEMVIHNPHRLHSRVGWLAISPLTYGALAAVSAPSGYLEDIHEPNPSRARYSKGCLSAIAWTPFQRMNSLSPIPLPILRGFRLLTGPSRLPRTTSLPTVRVLPYGINGGMSPDRDFIVYNSTYISRHLPKGNYRPYWTKDFLPWYRRQGFPHPLFSVQPSARGGGQLPPPKATSNEVVQATETQAIPSPVTIADWAHLLLTHTHEEFAAIATLRRDHACPPCLDISGVALLQASRIHNFFYGEWQGSLDIQACLEGIFKILQLDPSIALHQQHELDQILCLGEAPTRWTRSYHFPPYRGSVSRHPSHLLWSMAQWGRSLRHILYVPGILVHPRPLGGRHIHTHSHATLSALCPPRVFHLSRPPHSAPPHRPSSP